MGRKSIKSIVDSVMHVMDYQKYKTPAGIFYAFHYPKHIKMIKLEISDDLLPSTVKFRLDQSYLYPSDKHDCVGIFDPLQLDAMYETDPLCYVTSEGKIRKEVSNEKLKQAIREKFGAEALKPSEKFGSKTTLLGLTTTGTSPMITYSEPVKEKDYIVTDKVTGKFLCDKATIDNLSNVNNLNSIQTEVKSKKKESLESFLKRTKKVTRYCADCGCGTEIKLYRSFLKHGKGLFCSIPCSNLHKSDERITNTCHNCQMEYKSIDYEEFCCVECEEFFNQ